MKKLQIALALLLFTALPAFAQEYNIKWSRPTSHITTKTTTHVATSTCTLHTIVINVSNAGTTWTVSIQDLATTPQIVYAGTVATGTVVIELPVGISMTGGIDVVTAGTTAGVMDIKWAFH